MEKWKVFENSNFLISNFGNIKNTKTNKILKVDSRAGYCKVVLNKKTYYVHRLVAQIWIQNPNNLRCVNHKDGNKLNNNVENLEWISDSDNLKHIKQLNKIKKQQISNVEIRNQIRKKMQEINNLLSYL